MDARPDEDRGAVEARLEAVGVGPDLCGIPPLVLGYPKNSSKFSTAVKSNSFPTILGPSVLALRVLDDWREIPQKFVLEHSRWRYLESVGIPHRSRPGRPRRAPGASRGGSRPAQKPDAGEGDPPLEVFKKPRVRRFRSGLKSFPRVSPGPAGPRCPRRSPTPPGEDGTLRSALQAGESRGKLVGIRHAAAAPMARRSWARNASTRSTPRTGARHPGTRRRACAPGAPATGSPRQ